MNSLPYRVGYFTVFAVAMCVYWLGVGVRWLWRRCWAPSWR